MLCEACEYFRFPLSSRKTLRMQKNAKKSEVKVHSSSTEHGVVADSKSSAEVVVAAVSDTARQSNVNGEAGKDGAIGKLTNEPKLVVSELLSYISYYRDRASTATLKNVAGSFYSAAEIAAAKKLLVNLFQAVAADTSFGVSRRDSSTRTLQEAELDDILSLFNVIDSKEMLDNVCFVSADLERIPHYSPEKTNMCSIADRQKQLEAEVDKLTASYQSSVTALSGLSVENVVSGVTNTVMNQVDSKFNDCMSSMQCKLDSAVAEMRSFCQSVVVPVRPDVKSVSRELNVVMFGVAENRDRNVWCDTVSRVLNFVAGRTVDIRDAFRLGKYGTSKTRPVLVTLCGVWDKRLVLSNGRKLSTSDEFKSVYIVPDEPVEERRKKVLGRMRDRAVREKKSVSISEDGCLYVDGVIVYSLSSGKVSAPIFAINGSA